MANDGKPQEDKLVSQLIPDPAQGPPDATTLTGYLGRAPEPKEKGKGASWRLYQSPSLDCYVEIAEESILHTQKLPDDRGTIVWVPKSLQLRYVQVHSTQVQAEMLGSGSIAQGGMAGSPNLGPEGELGTSVATVCSTVTCPTLGLCLSQTTCPSMNIVCVTHTGPCLSAALSYCTICPPPSATPSYCHRGPPLSAAPSLGQIFPAGVAAPKPRPPLPAAVGGAKPLHPLSPAAAAVGDAEPLHALPAAVDDAKPLHAVPHAHRNGRSC